MQTAEKFLEYSDCILMYLLTLTISVGNVDKLGMFFFTKLEL